MPRRGRSKGVDASRAVRFRGKQRMGTDCIRNGALDKMLQREWCVSDIAYQPIKGVHTRRFRRAALGFLLGVRISKYERTSFRGLQSSVNSL